MRIYKNVKVENIKVDESEGIVEAFVNTMGRMDKDKDIIDSKAFNRSIEMNLPIPVLAGHDQSVLVGKVISAAPIEIDEDTYKLRAQMQMNMNTQSGKEAFSNVAGNFIREWSVGFNVPNPDTDIEYMEKDGETIRKINQLDWVEVSTVIRGASPETTTISAKQESETKAPVPGKDKFSTREEALIRAKDIGCSGAHSMDEDGATIYMPCSTHAIYEEMSGSANYSEEPTDRVKLESAEESASDTTENVALDTDKTKAEIQVARLRLNLKNSEE
tara:strand:- start:589 stop:1410 length:822 start_codon:yes stop_codon:yes gene_type:complete